MMTRRERMERRAARRHEWAEKARAASAAADRAASELANAIPLGQPILDGHHSAPRARRDAERIRSATGRAVERGRMAERHDQVAAGIERQLDRSIYSDDPDAAERLRERVAALEAERDRMIAINRAFRRGDAAALSALGLDLGKLQSAIEETRRSAPWIKAPYEGYQLRNLGARLREAKRRLAEAQR